MMTRSTKAKRSQPRKGKKQRGVGAFHSIASFEAVILLADADFSENMKNASPPTWKEGAKIIDPYKTARTEYRLYSVLVLSRY